MKSTHFRSAAEFRRWLKKNHAKADELWVAFYKKALGKRGMTYKEAVDEALCFGWIDGLLRSEPPDRFIQRFTPRRPGSNWSNINVANVQRLLTTGKMDASGLAAFAARQSARTGVYSFERSKAAKLPRELERKFRANRKAWAFFKSQPPGYQRLAAHKVISPKQPATRERWLARLIAESAAGQRLSDFKTKEKPGDRPT